MTTRTTSSTRSNRIEPYVVKGWMSLYQAPAARGRPPVRESVDPLQDARTATRRTPPHFNLSAMSTAERVAAIAGVAESDLGDVAPKTSIQLQAEAAREALTEAGLSFADVDALFSAGGETFAASMAIGEYLGISPRFTDSTTIRCGSFVS